MSVCLANTTPAETTGPSSATPNGTVDGDPIYEPDPVTIDRIKLQMEIRGDNEGKDKQRVICQRLTLSAVSFFWLA